jgi:hypothetical protein
MIFASKASPAIPTPGIPQEIVRRSSPAQYRWPDLHERKIAGATTEVPDQDEFVVVERRFVVVRRGHRLHLELNGFEPGNEERLAEPGLSVIVPGRIFHADKVNRAAHDGRPDLHAKLAPGLLAQISENSRDEIFEFGAPAEYVRTFQTSAGEKRF